MKEKLPGTILILQAITRVVPVPKEHHCHVVGKQGTRRKEIEQRTGTRIQMPRILDMSDMINITGTRDAVEKAVLEIRKISDALVCIFVLNR